MLQCQVDLALTRDAGGDVSDAEMHVQAVVKVGMRVFWEAAPSVCSFPAVRLAALVKSIRQTHSKVPGRTCLLKALFPAPVDGIRQLQGLYVLFDT